MGYNRQKFLKDLSHEDGVLIESIAGNLLDVLGYKRVYTKKGQERIFTESEIREFHRINKKLKIDKEKHSDPDDITRREKQNSVLNNIGLRPIS